MQMHFYIDFEKWVNKKFKMSKNQENVDFTYYFKIFKNIQIKNAL